MLGGSLGHETWLPDPAFGLVKGGCKDPRVQVYTPRVTRALGGALGETQHPSLSLWLAEMLLLEQTSPNSPVGALKLLRAGLSDSGKPLASITAF